MRVMDNHTRIREWVDSVGRADLMNALPLSSASAITNAIRKGRMPAWWHPVARRLSEKKGVEPPSEALFTRFGESPSPKSGAAGKAA